MRRGDATPPPGGVEAHGHAGVPGVVRLAFEGVGQFLVSPDTVVVDPQGRAPGSELGNLITGPALATLLHLRGHLVLHASCVGFGQGTDECAVAFMGDSAWGKSTAGAACVRAGHRLLADDTTALDPGSPEPLVIPAYPRIKLFPDSLEALGLDPGAYEPIHPGSPKRVLRAHEGFTWEPASLRRIYLLDGGGDEPAGVEPIEEAEAFVELVRHTFAVDLLEMTGTRARHFEQAAEVAARVPVRRLRVDGELANVTRIPAMVAEDLAQ